MTPEQLAGILAATASALAAFAAIFAQLRQLHKLTNSRTAELIELTRRASLAEGRLAHCEERGLAGDESVPG